MFDIKAILQSSDQPHTLLDALRPIFTQSPDCEVIFDRLFADIESIEANDDGSWLLTLQNDEQEACEITFDPPFVGEASEDVPPSFLALVRCFNGITYEGYLPMGLNGLDESGSIQSACGGWDSSYLEEGDNEGFLEKLAEADLSSADVPGPIDFFQNWIILHPAEANLLGEPSVYFVSHGDCEAVRVEAAQTLPWGPLMLRVLAQAILREDNDFLEEVYD